LGGNYHTWLAGMGARSDEAVRIRPRALTGAVNLMKIETDENAEGYRSVHAQ
jgi:hypothetical protein